MPNTFAVSKTDILKSKTITPGWYPALLKSVNQKAAKTDGSTNTIVTFVIQGGPFDGVPVDSLFSEKAPGFITPLLSAILGRPVNPEGEEVDLDRAVGKKISVMVVNDKYMNRLTNKIEDYKPLNS